MEATATLNKICQEVGVCESEPSDHELLLHFGIHEVGSPALIVDEATARATPCTCLPPGVMIVSNPQLKAIEKVELGDKVLGHDGYYHSVQRLFRRTVNTPLIEIKPEGFLPFTVTEEHPILSVPHARHPKGASRFRKTWLPVSKIKKGTILAYPILKETKDKESITVKGREIIINDDFLWLCGIYLAEGSVYDKDDTAYVAFSLNKDEIPLHKKLQYCLEQIGLHTIKPTGHGRGICYRVCSRWLVDFFISEMGTGANRKKIPHWAMTLPPSKQRSLLSGYWQGDGYYNNMARKHYNHRATTYYGGVATTATTSRNLANGIKILLLRQGIIPGIRERQSYGNHAKSYWININNYESLCLLADIIEKPFPRQPLRYKIRMYMDNDYLYTKVRNIKLIPFEGEVFNLEVEGANSYATEGGMLHNCFRYKGKDLCWSRGAIGMLKQEEQAIYCVAGKTYKEQPKLKARYERFAEAAEEAHKKIETMPKGRERLEVWLTEMGKSLEKRGISI